MPKLSGCFSSCSLFLTSEKGFNSSTNDDWVSFRCVWFLCWSRVDISPPVAYFDIGQRIQFQHQWRLVFPSMCLMFGATHGESLSSPQQRFFLSMCISSSPNFFIFQRENKRLIHRASRYLPKWHPPLLRPFSAELGYICGEAPRLLPRSYSHSWPRGSAHPETQRYMLGRL